MFYDIPAMDVGGVVFRIGCGCAGLLQDFARNLDWLFNDKPTA